MCRRKEVISYIANQGCIAAYLNLRSSAAIEACYGFDEGLQTVEIERLIDSHISISTISHRGEDVCDEDESGVGLAEAAVLTAYAWTSRVTLSPPTSIPRRSIRRISMRNEFMQYRASLSSQRFIASESQKFWGEAATSNKLPRLAQLARLLSIVPSSAIP